MLEDAGVDLVFAPSVEAMYPAGTSTFVEVGGLSERLDGASRPGHFRGVATVVSKLFHIVSAEQAFFGQKDAAQVAVLRKMVRDLLFPVRVVVCPTMREADGLAMSSRNRNLSPEERSRAVVLSQALSVVEAGFQGGEVDAAKLLAGAVPVLAGSVEVDYFRIVDADSLEDLAEARSGALVAVAARLGATRLIDNLLL
jgi:pantoate--beta-alanine ligase